MQRQADNILAVCLTLPFVSPHRFRFSSLFSYYSTASLARGGRLRRTPCRSTRRFKSVTKTWINVTRLPETAGSKRKHDRSGENNSSSTSTKTFEAAQEGGDGAMSSVRAKKKTLEPSVGQISVIWSNFMSLTNLFR